MLVKNEMDYGHTPFVAFQLAFLVQVRHRVGDVGIGRVKPGKAIGRHRIIERSRNVDIQISTVRHCVFQQVGHTRHHGEPPGGNVGVEFVDDLVPELHNVRVGSGAHMYAHAHDLERDLQRRAIVARKHELSLGFRVSRLKVRRFRAGRGRVSTL